MSDQFAYVDLELIVQKAGKNEFHVRAKSNMGEGEVTVPINPELKQALHSFGGASSAPVAKQMRKWGADLFEQAIRGDVLYTYQKCRDQAKYQGKKGVRWRLTLDSAAEELPWDFLRSERNFLAVDPSNPVVRYIKSAACQRVSVEHPLQLLVVIASPADFEPLDADAEKERIKTSLAPLLANGQVNISYIEGPDTWSRLQDQLLQEQTHMLHFIGHGNFDEQGSKLVMEDECGNSDLRESEDLAVLALDRPLQLVVLNSCFGAKRDDTQKFSSVAASMVRSGVPAVIAMRTEISDDAARAIAQTFYTALALNMPVDAALTEARRKIFRSDSLEWATPILYMQVPDGQLFRFGKQIDEAGGWQVNEIIGKGKNLWGQGLSYLEEKKKQWVDSRPDPQPPPRGLPPAQPHPPPKLPPPPRVPVTTSEQRAYLMDKRELTPLANAIQQCFSTYSLGSGKSHLENGSLIITGGRTPSDLVGTVKLEQDEKSLCVTLLGDRSAIPQQRLFDALWRTVESFVASCGGRPAPPNKDR